MTHPIGVDMASGRIVCEGEPFTGWLCVKGYADVMLAGDAPGGGRIFAEVAHRPSTGTWLRDPLAQRKWQSWSNTRASQRVGRRPLP